MQKLIRFVKWLYSDSLKATIFFALIAVTVAGVILFIQHPLQTIAIVVGGFIFYTLCLLITEWDK